MDFKLPYNWLKEFVDIRWTPEKFAEQLSLHSVSVERLHRLDDGLDRIVVGRVERIEAHPNADRLRVVRISTHSSLITHHSSLHQVVCGGTNLREGMLVAYAMVGAKVRWHGEGELVELKPAEIRGVRSEGMICAASEIGLGEWFRGGDYEILDLSFLENNSQLATRNSQLIGQPLAKALGLNDVIFDIEVTTNRPDLMSVEELARETAVIAGARMRAPSPKPRALSHKHDWTSGLQLTAYSLQLSIVDRVGCPRYGAVVIDGVKVGPSPWWMQRRLLTAGLRPINNVVDATNYAMLELGQPLHAFDAHRLQPIADSRKPIAITIRRAKKGESILALDGVTYVLSDQDIIIADAEHPIAIAGIIGGQESGVTEATTCVVLECANFDPLAIRQMSRRLNVRTDAAIRFEKGLQPDAIEHVLPRAIELIIQVAGGVVGKPIIAGRKPKTIRPIEFHPTHANEHIGVLVPVAQIRRVFTALGCRVQKKKPGFFSVTPPWWRRGDLEAEYDLIEEIARFYGYHKLPSVLPVGMLPAAAAPARPPRTVFDVEQRAREILADTGCSEVMAYSLASRAVIERCGFVVDQCVALENPLSEDFAYLRPSLIPTILPIIMQNEGHTSDGVVFEMGNVYYNGGQGSGVRGQGIQKRHRLPTTDYRLPVVEEMRLIVAGYGETNGDTLRVKGKIERLFSGLGVRGVEFRASEQCALPQKETKINNQLTAYGLPRRRASDAGSMEIEPISERGVEVSSGAKIRLTARCLWHPGRTMDVVVGGVLVGTVGEIHPVVVAAAGIGHNVVIAELDWAAVSMRVCESASMRLVPSSFPPVKRDIAFILDRKVPYADIATYFAGIDPLLVEFELFDVFEGRGIPDGQKSIAFHLTYSTPDRTLTAEEVEAVHAKLIAKLQERFGVEMRT